MKNGIETVVAEADYTDMTRTEITRDKLQGFVMRCFVSGLVRQRISCIRITMSYSEAMLQNEIVKHKMWRTERFG